MENAAVPQVSEPTDRRSDAPFTRCAVCKVDLKGRFVYLDEQAEALLSQGKDELFGRSLVDFLGEESRHLVATLFNRRNFYESFFDSLHLTIAPTGKPAKTFRAIVSLNFIAGNPVNFQFVFIPGAEEPLAATPVQAGESNTALTTYCRRLLKHELPGDESELVLDLLEFSEASSAMLYVCRQDSLELLASARRSGPITTPFDLAEGTTPLHMKVLVEGTSYAYTEPWPFPETLSGVTRLPSEFVHRIEILGSGPMLVRVLWDHDYPAARAQELVDRARLGSELLGRAMRSQTLTETTQSVQTPEITAASMMTFLDSGGMAAFRLVGGSQFELNGSASRILSLPVGQVDRGALFGRISSDSQAGLANLLDDSVPNPAADGLICVTLAGEPARISIARASLPDHSAVFVCMAMDTSIAGPAPTPELAQVERWATDLRNRVAGIHTLLDSMIRSNRHHRRNDDRIIQLIKKSMNELSQEVTRFGAPIGENRQ